MFPWLMPNAGQGGLLSMLQGSSAQGGPFGNPFAPDYWSRVNASRQPGEDNASVWFRGLLPQQAWPQQWRDPKYGYQPAPAEGDRSDQSGNQNQSDSGNAMAPPGQNPQGGPDNTQMSGYDAN